MIKIKTAESEVHPYITHNAIYPLSDITEGI